MCTWKHFRPTGSSISLSNPIAHLATRPSTLDISPGMLLTLWLLEHMLGLRLRLELLDTIVSGKIQIEHILENKEKQPNNIKAMY